MAELFEEVVSLLESRSATRALVGQFRIESEQAAGNGAVLGIPVFLSAMHDWANDPTKSAELLKVLRSIETRGLQDPGAAVDGRTYEPVGTELTTMLLGDRRGLVASVISSEAGISQASANGLLPPTGWAVIASIADRYGNRIDRQSLIAILSREHNDLLEGGWGPWLDATGETAAEAGADFGMHAAAQTVAADIPDYPPDLTDDGGSYPPPVTRSARMADEPTTSSGRQGTAISDRRAAAVNGPVSQRRESAARANPERFGRESEPSRVPAMLGVLLLFLLGAGAIYWLVSNRGDGDTATTDGGLQTETDQTAEETADAADVGSDVDAEADPAAPAVVDPALDGIVALDIMMDDPQGRSASTGVAELRFNTDTSEICYNVNAEQIDSPFDGHIHVGPAGVKGGIVVDFGPLDNAAIGCTPVIPAEIESILSDLPGHYVEMHDPNEVFTIRAQLSEAIVDGGGTPDDGVAADALFDPNSGGAVTRVEAGRLVLIGEVADQATMDLLATEFDDIIGPDLELVNELAIVDGAPRPSGRISIDDSVLFSVGSDQLSADRGTVIADLATVLNARPGWAVTIVGHTDSTGSEVVNLALSLRRAEAVRDELIADGVAPEALLIKGAGSTAPIGDNETAEGRALNRRTELIVDRG